MVKGTTPTSPLVKTVSAVVQAGSGYCFSSVTGVQGRCDQIWSTRGSRTPVLLAILFFQEILNSIPVNVGRHVDCLMRNFEHVTINCEHVMQ